jgi:hypothetical protein
VASITTFETYHPTLAVLHPHIRGHTLSLAAGFWPTAELHNNQPPVVHSHSSILPMSNDFKAVSFKPRVLLIPDSHVPPFYTSYARIYERYASVVCDNIPVWKFCICLSNQMFSVGTWEFFTVLKICIMNIKHTLLQ